MKIIDNEELQRMVDYSFGDHSGVLGGVPNAYMTKANISNQEFHEKVVKHIGVMTLFIDNIRLYRRPLMYSDWMHLKPISPEDARWLNQFQDEDLLSLLRNYPQNKFIIFTAFEDTPLDDYIWDKIPPNVVSINAANAVIFGDKIKPFPHGLERIMYPGYNHHEILQEYIHDGQRPSKLLFICHREDTGARGNIRTMFQDSLWATCAPKLEYEAYLQGIKDHKFVLCPSGNGIESARNWETLYMRRVPVFKDHPYLREMFKEFPALFVDSYENLTEELLLKNEVLYERAQSFSMDLLDLQKIYDLRLF